MDDEIIMLLDTSISYIAGILISMTESTREFGQPDEEDKEKLGKMSEAHLKLALVLEKNMTNGAYEQATAQYFKHIPDIMASYANPKQSKENAEDKIDEIAGESRRILQMIL